MTWRAHWNYLIDLLEEAENAGIINCFVTGESRSTRLLTWSVALKLRPKPARKQSRSLFSFPIQRTGALRRFPLESIDGRSLD